MTDFVLSGPELPSAAYLNNAIVGAAPLYRPENYWVNAENVRRGSVYTPRNGESFVSRIGKVDNSTASDTSSEQQDERKRHIDESKKLAILESDKLDLELAGEKNPEKRKAILKSRVISEDFIKRNNEVEIERLIAAAQKEGFVMRIVIEHELKRQGKLPSKEHLFMAKAC